MVAAQTSGPERDALALGTLARDCRLAGVERHVLLLRLSLLSPEYYRPHHGRLAESALEPLASADRVRLYRLPAHDVALAWRGDATAQERRVVAALQVLFAQPASSLPALGELVRRFRLPDDAELLAACLAEPASPPPAEAKLMPLDPASLCVIERALVSADMARFARRRPISRRDGGGRFRLAWEKRYFSLAEIGESLAPGCDITADPWLFRRLALTLDRRLLALLSAPHALSSAPPFAIDLNVESILSPAFLSLDAALPAALREKIVLGLLPIEILNDASAFLFARDFARSRGYRLALSAASASFLPMLSPETLKLDFLEIRYSSELASLSQAALDAALGERERIILTGADCAAALLWGEAQGFVLFQGRVALPVP